MIVISSKIEQITKFCKFCFCDLTIIIRSIMYEIFNNLRSVLFSNGYKNANEIEHGYRFAKLNSIAYEAVFALYKVN